MLPVRYVNPSGPQSKALWNALIEAFDQAELTRLLQFRLNKQLARLAPLSQTYDTIVFEVLNKARAQGWLAELVVGALEWNPHPDLYAVARDLGLTAVETAQTTTLERIVKESSTFLDIRPWLSKFGRIETQVCRVETPTSTGTGFLLGPDVLITNYHVLEDVIRDPDTASQVRLRFDYKVVQDDAEREVVSKGTTFRLADDWLIDHSPYSAADTSVDSNESASSDELDYALFRAAGEPGKSPVGGHAGPGVPTRGWIAVSGDEPDLDVGRIGFIVQHPKGAPLKLAFGAVTQVNDNRTRIRYDTNTEPGSSGSPVFDVDLKLLALHHAGDPDYARLARYNQGVPLSAILQLLTDRGKRDSIPQSVAEVGP